MIKKWYLRYLAVVMATIVLIGTVGITINAHYCSTHNTLEKSLFANVSCDHHHGQNCYTNDVTADSVQSCCKLPQNTQQSQECCHDFSKYVKLFTEFDLPKVKIVFNDFLTLAIRLFDFFIPVTEESKTAALSDRSFNTDTSLGGTSFLIACSQLKLDDPHLL